MPKARAKKKGMGRSSPNTARDVSSSRDITAPASSAARRRSGTQPGQRTAGTGYSSLTMPAMVVLGCCGLAVFYALYTTDPNRFLFAGMAMLMALMWGFSFWLRLRRMRRN